jgi:hypothetical protein
LTINGNLPIRVHSAFWKEAWLCSIEFTNGECRFEVFSLSAYESYIIYY